MSESYRDKISNIISAIDDDLQEIIEKVESGDYSQREIADELTELKKKIY